MEQDGRGAMHEIGLRLELDFSKILKAVQTGSNSLKLEQYFETQIAHEMIMDMA